jgi:hypothetical protein
MADEHSTKVDGIKVLVTKQADRRYYIMYWTDPLSGRRLCIQQEGNQGSSTSSS